jgi:hypothetical protein
MTERDVKTHLWSREQPGASNIHHITVCGLWDTFERPLVGTSEPGLVDCKVCEQRRPKP